MMTTSQGQPSLPLLPCACANLRRAARAATRMYNHELRPTGLELTQYTILMALNMTGEITQGELGTILSLDSTTLTRMLGPLQKHAWVVAHPGKDRRQRLLRLSRSGETKLRQSSPCWERAQKRLRAGLNAQTWNRMAQMLVEITAASDEA